MSWLKLHRSMLEWEWYSDLPCRVLFLHLLMIANHEDTPWQGIVIKAGQRVTSLDKLAGETGLSLQAVRTALAKLKSTGELTDTATSKYRIITVVKWNDYQGKQQASNKQATGEQQQYKNIKNTTLLDNNNARAETTYERLHLLIGHPGHLKGGEYIQRWMEAGASEAVIEQAIRTRMADPALKARPPSTLKYFDAVVAETITLANTPLETGNANRKNRKSAHDTFGNAWASAATELVGNPGH